MEVSPRVAEVKPPETYPQARADVLLADCLEVNGCWSGLEGKVEGLWVGPQNWSAGEEPAPAASLDAPPSFQRNR